MSASFMGGAAHEYLRRKFGGVFAELESRPATAITAASVIGNNPDRLGLLIINTGTSNITLGLNQSVTAGNGIVLASNGGSVSLDVEEDFTLPTREWFAIAASGTPALYVLELTRPMTLPQQEERAR